MLFDVHNHGAWGIDDGIACEEDCKRMLTQACADGITRIIATPHMVPGQIEQAQVMEMNERIAAYARLAQAYGITVYTGCELFLNAAYMDCIDAKAFNTLANSNYILVEFDMRRDICNVDVEEYLYEIHVRGYHILLAHVERYFFTKIDLQRVARWIAQGYYIQVNRTSIVGMHGTRNARNARRLLHHGLVHVVASDAHRAHGNRICKLSDAYAYIKKYYGQANAERVCVINPQHIVANEALLPMEKATSLCKKIWR